jgi:hypothetical protein
MKFFSSPFNFEDAKTNQLSVDLECITFEYRDPDSKKLDEPLLIGVHYWMEHESFVEGLDQIEQEDIKNKLFINRTTFNEQYFKLNFDEELEFITVHKHIMYLRELRAQDVDQDHDDISSQQGYDWLRTYRNTILLYESHE